MMDARPYDADESVAAAAAAAAAASEEAVLQWLLYGAGLVREFEESPDVLPSIRLLPPVQRIAVEADPNLTLLPSLRELQASEREQRAAASRNATASDVFDELPSEAHAIWADEALVESDAAHGADEESTREWIPVLLQAIAELVEHAGRRQKRAASEARAHKASIKAETEPSEAPVTVEDFVNTLCDVVLEVMLAPDGPSATVAANMVSMSGKLREGLATRKVNITKFDQEWEDQRQRAESAIVSRHHSLHRMNGAVEQLESVPACAEQIVNPFGSHQHDAEAWDWAFRSTSRGHPAPLLRAAPDTTSLAAADAPPEVAVDSEKQRLHIEGAMHTALLVESSDPTASMAKTIDLFGETVSQTGRWGPFLVVVPRNALVAWEAQLESTRSEFRVMPYWGSADDRASLRAYWDPLTMYTEVRPVAPRGIIRARI